MSGQNSSQTAVASLLEHSRRVDHACRRYLGFGIMVWRTLDSIVSLGALALAGHAINAGADPMISLAFAALIISGPKIVEWWLVNKDVVEYDQIRNKPKDE